MLIYKESEGLFFLDLIRICQDISQRGTWENWIKDNSMSRIKPRQFANKADRDHVKRSEMVISHGDVH